ncbi:MAG: hypothetical protein CSYNP_00480 [Syntrophus sp. SKADARSKE-3]|nr:hypothetical protein [Syntrophus sp. SKADARSKE-3]
MIDRDFFEFWGQLFLNVAKGQKQIEEMNSLFRQGMDGYESMRTLFRNIYGLDKKTEYHSNSTSAWEKSRDNFQTSFRQVLSIWGLVTKEDYDALSAKYDALEKRVGEQELTIKQLRMLLGERQDDAFATTKELQGLLSKQQAEFQALMNNLGIVFEKKSDSSSKKKH